MAMELLDIQEPEEREIAIGIDLGTTNSVVAVATNGKVRSLRGKRGSVTLPSVVAYNHDDTITVGIDAKERLLAGDDHAVGSAKRFMGRSLDDIQGLQTSHDLFIENGELHLNVLGHKATPVDISAEILKSIKQRAEYNLGQEIHKAVITVPAYFSDNARSATMEAAKRAGLEVLRLINEPTAAALAYGLDTGSEGIYAVYDLGGGTFDISLLKLKNGVFQVLATGGDTTLGGDDFDRVIAEYLLKKAGVLSPEYIRMIRPTARKVKELLSQEEVVSGYYELNGKKHNYSIDRKTFNKIIFPFVMRTFDIFANAIRDAKIKVADIQGVVMVGGATRVPLITDKVAEFTGKYPRNNVNPDEVVAAGAAIQAERLLSGGDADVLLLDVTPLSLGIETLGGNVEVLINRNTAIPYSTSKMFTNSEDGQTNILIHILQGEAQKAAENNTLAKFELSDIPAMEKLKTRIKVLFSIDENGMLTVTAVEEKTGKRQRVRVKAAYEAEHGEEAEDDSLINELALEQSKAASVVEAVDFLLSQCADELSLAERRMLAGGIAQLKMHMYGDNIPLLKETRRILAERTESVAKRHMSDAEFGQYFHSGALMI